MDTVIFTKSFKYFMKPNAKANEDSIQILA